MVNVPALCPRPTLPKPRQLAVTAHQRTTGDSGRLGPLADDLVMADQALHTLHRSGWQGLQLEGVPDQRRDRVGDHHCARRCQARHPRGQIGGKPVHVVLGGVQIHQPAVHPDPHADVDPKRRCGLRTELGHLAGDLQARQHGAADVVLVCSRIPEYRQQPVALGRTDMALKAVRDLQHQVAIAPNQRPVRLGLHPGGQHRRIDQIREQNR